MPIARVTDHVEASLDLLLDQYKEKPRIAALLGSETKQIQALEDAIWDTIIGRLIDNAVGVFLDYLGKIVGQERTTPDDELYRARIRTRIRANKSLGHPDDVIAVAILALALDPSLVRYTEIYPASFILEELAGIDLDLAPIVREFIELAKAPGVAPAFFFSAEPPSGRFTFAPGDTPVADTLRGFTDGEDPTSSSGGRWIDSL